MTGDTPRHSALGLRLGVMMLLQYMVWGAWLPLAARYLSASIESGGLGFTGGEIGMILGLAGSIGAISAPFIAGQLADRLFRTERVLACLLAMGAVVKWVTASQTSVNSWLWLSILYSVLYMPTLALSNSLAFSHLRDPDAEFPRVRVWGTIGWIAASWIFPMLWLQQDLVAGWMPPFLTGPEVEGVTARLADSLRFSGVISVLYAAYCMSLPATRPNKDDGDSLAFKGAFGLLRRPSFAVMVCASLLVSSIHQVYFLQAGPFLSAIGLTDSQIGPAMTVGQFSELAAMALLGWMLKTLGFRRVLTIGTICYALRYCVWSMVDLPTEILVASQFLHGFCYACFFAAAYIYVDRIAPPDLRHSAQTVFGIIILGGGPVIGGWMSGALQETVMIGDEMTLAAFSPLWRVLSLIGAGATLLIALCFRDETQSPAATD